jgi:hypothetical protein
VDSVLAEIQWLRDTFKVKEIFFQDDTLNVNREWFESLCSGLVVSLRVASLLLRSSASKASIRAYLPLKK